MKKDKTKSVKRFQSCRDALDFIDKLAKKKIHGTLHAKLSNEVHDKYHKFLVSADVEWIVNYTGENNAAKIEPEPEHNTKAQ